LFQIPYKQIGDYRLGKVNLFESFYVAFFKKRPPIQRACGGRRPQTAKLLFWRFFFAKLFSLRRWLPKKKAVLMLAKALWDKGSPPLVRLPSVKPLA
jgi:hypothetical protein